MNDIEAAALVIIGVSGSGKTTVGQALAAHLDCQFIDADEYHSPKNVAKMESGLPLDDADRSLWLATLEVLIREYLAKGETAVLACSALKKGYRDRLRVSHRVQFIYLAGTYELIWQRMQQRQDHYMKASMLQSQFDALEEPAEDEADIITISITNPVETLVDQILSSLPFGQQKSPNG